MKLFYGDINDKTVNIHDDEQQHILKVLRMKNGDEIYVTDGDGMLAKGNLIIEGKKAALEVETIEKTSEPFIPKLHIAIAPTKMIDRIEFFVEKAVEMGISEITFLQSEKTERKNLNIEKLQKQAIAASKQSLRFYFPKINDVVKFSDFIKTVSPEKTFVAHCNENLSRKNLHDIPTLQEITFLIGPEGDFSEKEIILLAEKNVAAVSLGFQRLRTETAGIFVASWNYSKMF